MSMIPVEKASRAVGAAPPPPAATSGGDSVLAGLRDWKTLAIVVGSVVAAGVGLWLLSAGPEEGGRPPRASSARRTRKRKGTSKPGSAPSTGPPSGVTTPLTPSTPNPSGGKDTSLPPHEEPLLEEVTDPVVALLGYGPGEIEALPKKSRETHAQSLKVRGNSFFSKRDFSKAIEAYTAASRFDPASAVYHANRAACYAALGKHAECISACDAALERDGNYVKALNRRGLAYEQEGRFEEALNDLTAACVLEDFQNETANNGMERVLQALSAASARKRIGDKEKVLPTGHVLKTYMESFSRSKSGGEYPDALGADEAVPGPETTGLPQYRYAERLMRERDFAGAEEAYGRALLGGGCGDLGADVRSLIMRGTFLFVRGDSAGASRDFEEALSREAQALPAGTEADAAAKGRQVEAMVKRACLLVESSNVQGAMELFARAEALDPRNADLHYHRGQVYFILQQLDEAVRDYRAAIELDPSSVVARIQLAVAQYRQERKELALRTFRSALRDHPSSLHARVNFAELLMDQGEFEEAARVLAEAREIDPTSGLAWVNEGLLRMQWRQDAEGMREALERAIEIDAGCDLAYVHLAQLRMQQDDLPGAAELFEAVAGLARTEMEMSQALQYLYACKAQIAFARSHPEKALQLREQGAAGAVPPGF